MHFVCLSSHNLNIIKLVKPVTSIITLSICISKIKLPIWISFVYFIFILIYYIIIIIINIRTPLIILFFSILI
jgi:hypothetical protein